VTGPFTVIHTIADLADRQVIPGRLSDRRGHQGPGGPRPKPEPSLAIANHAGWGPGQLEGEFDEGSWLALPATSEHIFWVGDEDLWRVVIHAANARRLADLLGIDKLPPDPRVN
jgi:hypothetical protein